MAVSYAHGRNYLIGFGHRGGPPRDERATFRVWKPNGTTVRKTVNIKGTIEEPVALCYKVQDKWVILTIVDKKNLPDWAKNYTEAKAVRI